MRAALIALISRVRSMLTRERLAREIADELRMHVDLLTERYIASGMTADAARAAARRQLGNVTLVQEDIYRMNSVQWIDVLAQDVRYACRMVARNRTFAAVVVLTLALGIGANTGMLSLAYSVLLKPLPYPDPDQIYAAEVIIPERRAQLPSLPPTVQTYRRWRESPTVFSAMAALTPWEASLTGSGEPERLDGAKVSATFFSFFGMPMTLGREFSAEEEQPGHDQVVVISDALWRRRFGADPAVIGRTIVVNGTGHLVVGVAPASLLVPTGTQLHPLLPFGPRVDIWKPVAATQRMLNNESWDHGVLVRLPDPERREEGRQQLAAILIELARIQAPRVKTQLEIQLVPVREIYAGKARFRLLLVLAASALLLLTACASIANVFLARVASRANELATRISLGAGRGRILSQTLTESILLSTLGGASGALLAIYGTRLVAAHGPDDVRLLADTHVNLPFLLFSTVVTLATGVICGIVPAWNTYRRDPAVELKEAGRATASGRSAGRSREVLVAMEIALATVLLASAGLLLHSFVNVMKTDRGYVVDRVLTADLSLFGQRYESGEARIAFYLTLLEKLRALPGVSAAGAISNLPALSASTGNSRTVFHPTDTDFQALVLSRPVAMIRSVTAGYFSASGTPLRAGRLLTDDEPDLAAVVSEALVARLWPGEHPVAVVGRQIRFNTEGPLTTIVGVVADARPGGLEREPAPVVYRPYPQWASGPMTIVMRTASEPTAFAASVRGVVASLDPNLPVSTVRTMREIVSATVAQRRFQMMLTSLFAVVALLLGAVGVYGVVSFTVASRTRDIGVRMALGAVRLDVMRWVFAVAARPVLIGLGAGLLAATISAAALRSVLFDVAPADPLSLLAVAIVLLLASALACYVPARRAAAVDPLIALRQG